MTKLEAPKTDIDLSPATPERRSRRKVSLITAAKVGLSTVVLAVSAGCLNKPADWHWEATAGKPTEDPTEQPLAELPYSEVAPEIQIRGGDVGDSVTVFAQNGGDYDQPETDTYLRDLINAAGYHYSMSAIEGATTDDLRVNLMASETEPGRVAGGWKGQSPHYINIRLGTNDLLRNFSPEQVRDNVRDYLGINDGLLDEGQEFRPLGALCVTLFGTAHTGTVLEEHNPQSYEDMLQETADLPLSETNGMEIRYVDVDAIATATPGYLPAPGPDGNSDVHPALAGRSSIRQQNLQAFDDCQALAPVPAA